MEVYIIGFIIAGILAFIIGKDAEERGMSGGVWGLFTFLFAIIAIPMYLIARKPLLSEQQPKSLQAGMRICPHCHLANVATDKHCHDCGTKMMPS